MTEGFKSFIIATLLIGLCVFGMFQYILFTQLNNNTDENILDYPILNETYSTLYVNLSSVQGTAESQRQGFEQETPTLGADSFLFSSIIGAAKIFTSTVANIFSTTFVYVGSVLGIPPVVIGVFVAIALITLILLAWRLHKVGE